MAVPSVAGLRYRNWRESSTEQRIVALQQMEDALAAQQEREPCSVSLMSECPHVSGEEGHGTRGLQRGQEIWINDLFVSDESPEADRPYMATEILFHESEHAYQDHIAANPDLAEDPQQLQDFTTNRGPGYLTPEQDGDAEYLAQPVEKDARDVARERTEEFCGGETEDGSGYSEHRQQMEAEEERYHRTCVDHLGDDYKQIARQKAFEKYERHELHEQQASVQAGADTDEALTQQEGQSQLAAAPAGAEELGEEAGKTAGQVAGEAPAGPAGAAAGDAAGEETVRATGQAAEEASENAGLTAEPPAEAAQETAEEASETTGQSDEAIAAPSEQEEGRDYEYGYAYGL